MNQSVLAYWPSIHGAWLAVNEVKSKCYVPKENQVRTMLGACDGKYRGLVNKKQGQFKSLVAFYRKYNYLKYWLLIF
jgi:hypothetical protein